MGMSDLRGEMGHYRSNLRDIEFNLFEWLRTQEHMGVGPFAGTDESSARAVLHEANRVAVEVFSDSFVEGDRTPLMLDGGEVRIPAGVKRCLDTYFDGEWHRLNLPPSLGGQGVTRSLGWSVTSLFLGANPAAICYTSAPTWAGLLDSFVTAEQRTRYLVPMVERRWGATMVLTEADAGSDVGAGRTKAMQCDGGIWQISGVKRFITSGEFDWPENIVHLVLARPEGGAQGAKALSMFFVPKYWVERDGSLGARNGVVATRLENKMGVRASATCELSFGARTPARGVLVGETHDGMRQMFSIMNHARMLFGAKAMETLSTGYLNALAYARTRIQGTDLAQALHPDRPRVPILRHPDVRRMLLDQKAHAEGLRALLLYTAAIEDGIALEPENLDLARRRDLLIPLIKGYGAEKSYEQLAQSMQILGGSGYMRDYPIEQYLRDVKVDTIWEGTTGIQALDLVFRKIAKDQAVALGQLLEDARITAKGNGRLTSGRSRLGQAIEDVEGMVSTLVGFLGDSVYLVGLNATQFLFALAELVVGWLLLQQAEISTEALDRASTSDADRAFYQGKLAIADWYTRTVLPGLSARRAVVESTTLEAMELSDDAF
jgi:alkylation response protein AidB-like acyl-CoA dehydrogenase